MILMILIFFLLILIFLPVFIVLQVILAKRRKTYFGYCGCIVFFAISLPITLIFIFFFYYLNAVQLLAITTLIFLLINIPTVILLLVTIYTNRKHKNKVSESISELDIININDLE